MHARPRDLIWFLLAAAAGLATAATAAEHKLIAEVMDDKGSLIRGARVVVTSPDDPELQVALETRRSGRFELELADPSIRYHFQVEAEGHRTFAGLFQPTEGTNRHSFILPRIGSDADRKMQEDAATQEAAQAERDAAAAREREAGQAIDLHNEAVRLLEAGDLEAGEARLREALELAPEQAPSLAALAGILVRDERVEDGLETAEAALAIDGANARALAALHDGAAALGDDERALAALEKLAASDRPVEAAIRWYNRGAERIRQGDAEGSVPLFERALASEPTMAAAHYGLAAAQLNLGRFAAAAEAAEGAIASEPGYTPAHKIRFEAYQALGDEAKAGEALEALLQADPTNGFESLVATAQTLFDQGEVARAGALLDRLLGAEPEHPKALYLRGLVALNRGDSAGAKTRLETFLRLAPDHPEAAAAREILAYL